MLKIDHIETNVQNPVFQLFFLINNVNQDVEVIEVRKIDFTEVKKRLEKGESVFITRKRKKKLDPLLVTSEEIVADPWFFTHL